MGFLDIRLDNLEDTWGLSLESYVPAGSNFLLFLGSLATHGALTSQLVGGDGKLGENYMGKKNHDHMTLAQ